MKTSIVIIVSFLTVFANVLFAPHQAPAQLGSGDTSKGTSGMATIPMSFTSLTPTHGLPGTPVLIKICGFPATDRNKAGTITIGGTSILRMRLDQTCNQGGNVGWGGDLDPWVLDIVGPPGPVSIRVDVPGTSHPVDTINFTVDPGPPITWNPRFMLVLRGQGVLDKETSLVWQRVVKETAISGVNAAGVCRREQTGDRLGWRVPTAAELGSLLDPMNESPALPIGHPFVLKNSSLQVWISDQPQSLSANSGAWEEHTWGYTVNLKDGKETGYYLSTRWSQPLGTPFKATVDNPTLAAAVWCVRGPVSGPIP